jgi:ribonuclease inhibitor
MNKTIRIDVSRVTNQLELHTLRADSLLFPSFYGRNWDAFWDAITGLVEMPDVLELEGIDHLERNLPHEAAQLIACLRDLGEKFPEIRCVVRYVTAQQS